MGKLYVPDNVIDRWLCGEFREVTGERCLCRFDEVSVWLAEIGDEYISRYYPEAGMICRSGFLDAPMPPHERLFARMLSSKVRSLELEGQLVIIKPPRNYADVARLYALAR